MYFRHLYHLQTRFKLSHPRMTLCRFLYLMEANMEVDIKKLLMKFGIPGIAALLILFFVLLVLGKGDIAESKNKDILLQAVSNTYASDSYNYTYEFNVQIAYKYEGVFGPWANATFDGEVFYKANPDGYDQFYVNRNLSGLLLPDTQQIIYNIDDNIITLNMGNDDVLVTYPKREIGSNYLLETSIFGDILTNLNEDMIASLSYFESRNEYVVNLDASSDTSLITSLTEASKVIEITSSDSPVSVDSELRFAMEDSKIKSFSYEVEFNILDIYFTISYTQTFVSFYVESIENPTPEGYLLDADLLIAQNYLKNLISTQFSNDNLAYDFFIDTEVDPGIFDFSLGTHSVGFYYQTVIDDVTYFTQRFEFDGDYEPEKIDHERYRALINDGSGEIWDEHIVIYGSNDFELVNDTNYIEVMTMFLYDFDWIIDQSMMIEIIDTDEFETYRLLFEEETFKTILEKYNDMIDFDIFSIESGLQIGDTEIEFIVQNGNLKEITMNIDGVYFDNEGIKQNLDYIYEITFLNDVTYIPPTSIDEIK